MGRVMRSWRLLAARTRPSRTWRRRSTRSPGMDQLLWALLQLHVVPALRQINDYLVRWATWKYKRLRRSPAKARRLIADVFRRQPGLFAHWRLGVRPDGWTMGAR